MKRNLQHQLQQLPLLYIERTQTYFTAKTTSFYNNLKTNMLEDLPPTLQQLATKSLIQKLSIAECHKHNN
jgi:hypothetical protein